MAAPNFQTSGTHRLYLGIQSAIVGNANFGQPYPVTNYADGTNLSGGTGLTDGIAELYAAGGNADLVPTLNVRDLNEDASENTVDITTRADSAQGIVAEVITSTSRGFNYEMLYKANDPAAIDLANTYTDAAFRALLIAANTSGQEIFGIDVDGPLDIATPANDHGRMGQAGNWTISLGRAKAVSGVVMQTATFSLSTFGEWVVFDGTAGTPAWVRYQ